jgi:hypothetical protein
VIHDLLADRRPLAPAAELRRLVVQLVERDTVHLVEQSPL